MGVGGHFPREVQVISQNPPGALFNRDFSHYENSINFWLIPALPALI